MLFFSHLNQKYLLLLDEFATSIDQNDRSISVQNTPMDTSERIENEQNTLLSSQPSQT